MTDRTIDISKGIDFNYPNVVGAPTDFFLTFPGKRLLHLKSRHTGLAGGFEVASGNLFIKINNSQFKMLQR